MLAKRIRELSTQIRLTTFMFRIERKIHQIFCHLHGRRSAAFPFSTASQMNQQTALRDLRVLLDLVDKQSPEMGKAYGEAFRYLLHHDIYARLERYVRHVQIHVPTSSRVRAFTN